MAPFRTSAPAKLNLALQIGPKAADGFHPLASWFVAINLVDDLSVEPLHNSPSFTCSDPSLPIDENNLARKAINLYSAALAGHGFDVAHKLLGDLSFHLHKRIPAGGGLGGGSSDAAAALRICEATTGPLLPAEEIRRIAAILGSDVPFFMVGGSAWCTGRGEFVRPVPMPKPKAVLLMFPPFGMSTPAVYRRFDELAAASGMNRQRLAPELPVGWDALDALPLLDVLHNDLAAPAFNLEPRLADLSARARATLGRPIHMSGSGSTLFTIYDTTGEATAAAPKLESLVPAAVAGFLQHLPEITAG